MPSAIRVGTAKTSAARSETGRVRSQGTRRALQGVGAAAILPGITALMVWVTPPRQRGRTAGSLIGLMMLGIALGPLLGALLVGGPGWRTIFLLAGAIPFALFPLVLLRCPETGHDPRTRVPRLVSIAWAAGIVALESMVERLAEDHLQARRLAAGLAALPGVAVRQPPIPTNILVVEVAAPGWNSERLVSAWRAMGVLSNARPPLAARLVTHRHISAADVDYVIEVTGNMLAAA